MYYVASLARQEAPVLVDRHQCVGEICCPKHMTAQPQEPNIILLFLATSKQLIICTVPPEKN